MSRKFLYRLLGSAALCLLPILASAATLQEARGVNINAAMETLRFWNQSPQWGKFDDLRSFGFNAVRLPIKVGAHYRKASGGMSEAYASRLDEWVLGLSERGYTVIVDVHEPYFSEFQSAGKFRSEDQLLELWKFMATRYRGKHYNVHFEIINEPYGAGSSTRLNQLYSKIIPEIRAIDPQRSILIEPYRWAEVEGLAALELPSKERVSVSVHYYAPMELTHQGASWNKATLKWLGTTWSKPAGQSRLSRDFKRAATFISTHDVNIVLTEFGVISNAHPQSRTDWLKSVREVAEQGNIGWFYWALEGSDFGIYNEKDGCWRKEVVSSLLNVAAVNPSFAPWCR